MEFWTSWRKRFGHCRPAAHLGVPVAAGENLAGELVETTLGPLPAVQDPSTVSSSSTRNYVTIPCEKYATIEPESMHR
jgi:hypothetical protein